MNKAMIMAGATVGMTIGGVVPMLFGDNNMLDGWSILGGLIGGVIGIWVGVKVGRLMS